MIKINLKLQLLEDNDAGKKEDIPFLTIHTGTVPFVPFPVAFKDAFPKPCKRDVNHMRSLDNYL